MTLRKIFLRLITHLSAGAFGFALGIYMLPILIAPTSPTASEVARLSVNARYFAVFNKELKGSDAFHWGEGQVSIGPDYITLTGRLAPGPDYKLYLSTTFVETESDVIRLKDNMVRVGDVNTFENFVVKVPQDIDVSRYTSLLIWCEAFGEFITAAKYQ